MTEQKKPYVYDDYGLGGNAINLAHNLWNQEMMRRRDNGKTDLANSYEVITEKIVPEVENFVRQQCAKVARDWKAPMPPDFDSLALVAAADELDAKLRPIQEGAAKKVAEAIFAREVQGQP